MITESFCWGYFFIFCRSKWLSAIPASTSFWKKNQFVNPQANRKAFRILLKAFNKEIDKHKYIHGQLIVYFDFQFKAEDWECSRYPQHRSLSMVQHAILPGSSSSEELQPEPPSLLQLGYTRVTLPPSVGQQLAANLTNNTEVA